MAKKVVATATFPYEGCRYRGTVRYVNSECLWDQYGYIDQNSVVPIGDAPPLKHVKKDEGIYVSRIGRPLRVGMQVEFCVAWDAKRKNCFRTVQTEETSASRLAGMTEGGVEIRVQDKKLQDATIFVSWCLAPRLSVRLGDLLRAQQKLKLLLVCYRLTGDEKNPFADEKRQLVDLKADMAVLSFDSSGPHRLVAVVVWGQNENALHDTYLGTNDGRYKTTVISRQGDCLFDTELNAGSGCVDLEIPAELFAPKPRHYDWVNSFYTVKKPKNECRFFWRSVAIIVLQFVRIPWMCIKSTLKLIVAGIAALALHSVGMRDVAFRAFAKHPYRTPVGYVWANLHGSRYWKKKDGRDLLLPFIFSPAFLIIVGAATLYYFGFRSNGVTGVVNLVVSPWDLAFAALRMTFYAVVTVVILAGAVYFGGQARWDFQFGTPKFIEDWQARRAEARKKAQADARARRELELEEERRIKDEQARRAVNELICTTTGPRAPDPTLLPLSPRTIYFKAVNWKRKRCRNFSAG
jgi:hypothetical protein